jgi:hypothetical protein
VLQRSVAARADAVDGARTSCASTHGGGGGVGGGVHALH